MSFELGETYIITKPDGREISFKFIGGNPALVECEGNLHELMVITAGTFVRIRKA